MRTEENIREAHNFWRTLGILKMEKFPNYTWRDLCDRAGVNYSTFRSAKSNDSLPSGHTISGFANAFGVSVNYLLTGTRDKMALRRRAVADCIMDVDEATFILIERMLGLAPKKEQV